MTLAEGFHPPGLCDGRVVPVLPASRDPLSAPPDPGQLSAAAPQQCRLGNRACPCISVVWTAVSIFLHNAAAAAVILSVVCHTICRSLSVCMYVCACGSVCKRRASIVGVPMSLCSLFEAISSRSWRRGLRYSAARLWLGTACSEPPPPL